MQRSDVRYFHKYPLSTFRKFQSKNSFKIQQKKKEKKMKKEKKRKKFISSQKQTMIGPGSTLDHAWKFPSNFEILF